MMLSNLEIVGKFKRADNKKEMLKILSELNACKVSEIRDILIAEGVDPNIIPKPRIRKVKSEPVVEKPDTSEKPKVTRKRRKVSDESKELESHKPAVEEHTEFVIPEGFEDIKSVYSYVDSLFKKRDALIDEIATIDVCLDSIIDACKRGEVDIKVSK